LIAVPAVLTALGLASSASASPIRECGHRDIYSGGAVAHVYNITTRGMNCDSARQDALPLLLNAFPCMSKLRYFNEYLYCPVQGGVWTDRVGAFMLHGDLANDVRATAIDGRVIRFQVWLDHA
jgi:hypothetical protein